MEEHNSSKKNQKPSRKTAKHDCALREKEKGIVAIRADKELEDHWKKR